MNCKQCDKPMIQIDTLILNNRKGTTNNYILFECVACGKQEFELASIKTITIVIEKEYKPNLTQVRLILQQVGERIEQEIRGGKVTDTEGHRVGHFQVSS